MTSEFWNTKIIVLNAKKNIRNRVSNHIFTLDIITLVSSKTVRNQDTSFNININQILECFKITWKTLSIKYFQIIFDMIQLFLLNSTLDLWPL